MKTLKSALFIPMCLALVGASCSGKKAETATNPNFTLSAAVARGDVQQVQKLLTDGVNPNENLGSEKQALTPLLIAVVLNRSEIARILIKNGANSFAFHLGYTARDLANYLDQDAVAAAMEGH